MLDWNLKKEPFYRVYGIPFFRMVLVGNIDLDVYL